MDHPAITETELFSAPPGVVLVEVVLIFVADAGVAELPGSAGAFAGICGDYSSEGVFPVDVDMVPHKRVEACDIFVSHGVALGPQPVEGGVDIDGVPENDAVQDDTQRAKLVLHSFPVPLEQFHGGGRGISSRRARAVLPGGCAFL